MAIRDRAVVCTAKPQNKTSERACGNRKKGVSQMLSKCVVFMVLVFIGCFAAGSCELAAERTERRRVQKHIRDKYGMTY